MFNDRHQAGTLLTEKLAPLREGVSIVLALPRGGVVVAAEIAKSFKVPFDVIVVKKIPRPAKAELGIGALAPDGVSYIDWKMAHRVGADEKYINEQSEELSGIIKQKLIRYRKGKKPLIVKDKTVLVVDDGLATGVTMEAAVKWLRAKKARRVMVAIPVAPPEVVNKIKRQVDELVVLETPGDFGAVGQFYKEFPQVEDSEVIQLLRQ